MRGRYGTGAGGSRLSDVGAVSSLSTSTQVQTVSWKLSISAPKPLVVPCARGSCREEVEMWLVHPLPSWTQDEANDDDGAGGAAASRGDLGGDASTSDSTPVRGRPLLSSACGRRENAIAQTSRIPALGRSVVSLEYAAFPACSPEARARSSSLFLLQPHRRVDGRYHVRRLP